ncbi:hypothetical protein [Microbacterium sp. 2RAF4]|uniref:hypothetical protein n=1 Tax=Microbacterium sp. 2RAF4 TaxID=3232999 RepID=UPI003F96B584
MEDIAIDDGGGTPLVPRAHRVVRTLDPAEGPFPGTLVTHGDEVVVRVDAARLGGWSGWRYSGAEHIAAPIDVSRRRDGHDALFPWCTDRVRGYLGRRAAAGSDITAGETSTLVVSLLRGLDELGEGLDGVHTGTWWLTDGGRPVFVIGEGTDVRTGVVEILDLLGEQSADKVVRRALSAIGEGLRKTLAQPRLPRKLTEAWETTVLDVAAPQPLRREFHTPERARDVARAVGPRVAVVQESAPRLRADRVRQRDAGRPRAISAVVDAAQTVIFELRVRSERRSQDPHARSAPPRRGGGRSTARSKARLRSLAIAGGAAAAVLVGGLLLPGGDLETSARGAPGDTETPPPASSGEASDIPTPRETDVAETGATEPGSADSDDPVEALSALLRIIAECDAAGDGACTSAVAGNAEGIVDVLSAKTRVPTAPELVDAYGDVAVMRLRATSESDAGTADDASSDETVVVLLRTDEKWLVRDVYDVADQPG